MTGVRILIVDDYPENLLALEAVLKSTEHTIVRADSGRAALKAMLAQDFALVLMDVAMPDLDGYETAELIRGRERSRHTPIIFLTANSKADAHVFKGYSVGAVDYLFKPFVPEILLSKVSVFVELYTKRAELKEHAQALERAYGEMEQRVADRTSELRAEVIERKRVEAERATLLEREQEARRDAETMNRMKDEFLGTLSHELRTPLNAILGWTSLLEAGNRDATAISKATRVIKSNALMQAQLIADILDVSRIISGKMQLQIAPVSLQEVILATLETLHPAAEAKGIEIEPVLGEIEPVPADRDRLQQVMWNLLSNAIKFTPKDGHVRVTLEPRGDDVCIIVEDDGQGIPSDFLPHVFDRFRQADSSFARTHGGLGLGMAIVRHLVELHGGRVTVASGGLAQGATFTVWLPVRMPAIDHQIHEMPSRASSPDLRQEPLPSLAGVSVLVVDDEADAREVLTLLLQERGAVVTPVASADEALQALEAHQPDVLISDISMPGHDGYAFIRKIRLLAADHGGEIPAVALTAHVSAADATAAIAAGFDRHLAKPIVLSEIVEAVASLSKFRRVPSPDR